MAKQPKHKLDIFETLSAIDQKDYDFLQRQPAEARKAFAPVVALRWAGVVEGAMSEAAILLTNEIANRDFFDLYEHPELQYRSLVAAGIGKRQRHTWIPFPKQSPGSEKLQQFIGQFYPMASNSEIEMILEQFSREEFVEWVNGSGCTPDQAKEIVSAFDKKI